jgi:hypothetical protein
MSIDHDYYSLAKLQPQEKRATQSEEGKSDHERNEYEGNEVYTNNEGS